MMKFLIFVAVAGAVAYFSCQCCHKSKQPLFRHPDDVVWGDSKADPSVKPFSYKVDQKQVEDLKRRLANWRQHKTLNGVGDFYGITYSKLQAVVEFWQKKYDFDGLQSRLNRLPQFTTVIHGLKVHFIHAKADSKAKTKIPMVISHGWPGSVVEFMRLIPLLTTPDENGVAFDVVAPSIPGFGFSEAANRPGFSPIAIAQVYNTLMNRLGYQRYVYQGGDWGSIIGSLLSRMFPDNVIGYHSNFFIAPFGNWKERLHFIAAKIAPELVLGKEGAATFARFDLLNMLGEQMGYFHIQATKPDTLAVALSDSPVGTLAWYAEKFEAASDHSQLNGHSDGISNSDMLDNVMVYWLTNTIASSSRLYKELFHDHAEYTRWLANPIPVPAGVACYPKDAPCSPKPLLRHVMPHLAHYTTLNRGGHFAAMEEPELFNRDFRAAVKSFVAANDEASKKKAEL